MSDAREGRIADVVGAVARQALLDYGARRVALLDDGGPEAVLAARLLVRALGEDAIVRVADVPPGLESSLQPAGRVPEDVLRREARRLLARLTPDALPAHPANKTALLLSGPLPPEPLLPLGDLWASEVAALAGGWSAPELVTGIAQAAGGIEALDAALRRWIDARDPAGLDALPAPAADAVRRAFAAGRASRLASHVVPKLGWRTLGLDLLE